MATLELTPISSYLRGTKLDFWKNTPSFQIGQRTFVGLPSIPSIPQSDNDVYHTVTSGDEGRLDLISYQYYKMCEFWWAIAIANDIYNPVEEVVSGMLLRIPAKEVIIGQVLGA